MSVHKESPESSPEYSGNENLQKQQLEVVWARNMQRFCSIKRKLMTNSKEREVGIERRIELKDLREFADTFKLHTPIPPDMLSIIAKDPVKQKELQEKASLRRSADTFKLHTPVQPDMLSIIAKDPIRQKELQEKAMRNIKAAAAKHAGGP